MKTKSAVKKLVETVPNPAAVVTEYNTLRFQMEALEKRMRACKTLLEKHLETQPEHSAEIAGWLCTLSQCERENFSLAKARESLEKKVFAKYIEPLITTSEYTQIRCTYKGGEEA